MRPTPPSSSRREGLGWLAMAVVMAVVGVLGVRPDLPTGAQLALAVVVLALIGLVMWQVPRGTPGLAALVARESLGVIAVGLVAAVLAALLRPDLGPRGWWLGADVGVGLGCLALGVARLVRG